jgi:hypothetical protein
VKVGMGLKAHEQAFAQVLGAAAWRLLWPVTSHSSCAAYKFVRQGMDSFEQARRVVVCLQHEVGGCSSACRDMVIGAGRGC